DHGRDGARVDADRVADSVATARENLAEIEGLRRWVIVAEGVATLRGRSLGAIRGEFGATDAAIAGTATWLFDHREEAGPEGSRFEIVHGPVLELPGVDPATAAVLRLALLDAMHAGPTAPES
nr:hypothetical protein [Deltaproteobacteria bacterium]